MTDGGAPEVAGPRIGVILAGGLARRMGGGDKGARVLAGQSLLTHVIARIRPQVDDLMLNANGDPGRFATTGLPVVADSVPDHPGPLAGVLAGLDWAAARHGEGAVVVSVPVDAPLLPADLVERLASVAAPLACAASGGRLHPVIGLWPVHIRETLRRALVQDGVRKIDRFTALLGIAAASWSVTPHDPFLNVNREEDLGVAEEVLRGGAGG